MNSTNRLSTAFRTGLTARRSLVRNIVLLMLLTGGAILTVVIVGAYRAVGTLSESLIEKSADRTEAELKRFFEPVTLNLLVTRDWGAWSTLDVDDVRALNGIFIPQLARYPQLSSMMIADAAGYEYMLLQYEGEWRNRVMRVDATGTRAQWWRWGHAPHEALQEWWDELDYDPRNRPWYQGAMDNDPADMHWTAPYTFFTTKDPGITASVRWNRSDNDSQTYVAAYDIMLRDVSKFTSSIRVGERGATVVLTENGRVLGLPRDDRFADSLALKASVLLPADSLGVEPLTAATREWNAAGRESDVPIKYSSGGETWWAGFRRYALSPERGLWIGVLVPESDILGQTVRQRNVFIGITLVVLALGIVVAIAVDRSYQKRLSSEVLKAKQLGQYRLEEKIGEGGMGSVYKARHSMLRRPTAVKLIRSEQAAHPQALSRFEREVQMTSGLTHPNTISVYDYGRTPDGIFYYAMEYLVGVTLEDLVTRTGPVPADRAIYILQQVCGSLAEAHGAGLIHRDIKPANIMLCERGGVRDFVKVLDFGLVKEVKASEISELELTEQGSFVGTPLYVAPESVETPETVDARSDLYLVGGVAYFMLTNTLVFDGSGWVQVLAQHLNTEPEPPSLRVPGIPSDLEAIVLQCLAKKPADRPASAAELSAMLGSCAEAGKWDPERARVWWEDHGEVARASVAVSVQQSTETLLTIDLAGRSAR